MYNICSGEVFAKIILNLESTEQNKNLNLAIKNHYCDLLKLCGASSREWYPNEYRKNNDTMMIDSLLRKSIMKEWIAEGILKTTVLDFNKKIREETKKYSTQKKKLEKIYKNPNYMGILDEKFHTLIAPRALGPYKFWSVISAYTRAYVTICGGIMNEDIGDCSFVKKLLSDPHEAYKKIVKKIDENPFIEKESYYKIIAEKISDSEKKRIITTNYAPIAEKITGSLEKNVAYIHGNIKLFESPYYLQVKDISEDTFDINKFRKEVNFPYIFIQSGVKPIVEINQLKAFSKMLNILDEIEVLIVIGYNFNIDDNHINSILHEFLHRKGEMSYRSKKIVYFDYCSTEPNVENRKNQLLDQLRIPFDNRGICESCVRFDLIPIKEDNALNEFAKVLDELIS